MAAPKGNRFWEKRTTIGREKIFTKPELLLQAACEYFEWCEENPFYEVEAKVISIGDYQSKVEQVELPKMRPFTIAGLCIFLDIEEQTLNNYGKKKQTPEGWECHWEKDNSNFANGINPHAYRLGFIAAKREAENQLKEKSDLEERIRIKIRERDSKNKKR